jgi:hypothetical protein
MAAEDKELIPEVLPEARDEKGRFRKGYGGGPGSGHVSALRKAYQDACTVADIQEIMRVQIRKAIDDKDTNAAHFVFSRLFGTSGSNAKVKLIEDKSVTVQIARLSDQELANLEAMALKAIPAVPVEARLIEDKGGNE